MVKRQYRWTGMAKWQSQSGNAIIAIQNSSSSTRRVIINSFEVDTSSIGSSAGFSVLLMGRSFDVTDGKSIPLVKMDTESSLPSGVTVKVDCACTLDSTFQRIVWYKNFNQAGNSLPQKWGKNLLSRYINRNKVISDVENIILRPGEDFAIVESGGTCSQLLRISGTLVVQGAPKRNFRFSETVRCLLNSTVIAFENGSASDIIEIVNLNIEEVGTTDTPYLQLVPIGGVDPNSVADSIAITNPSPMDTADGSLDSNVKIVMDAPLLPYGVPVSYISESSTATPKGYNYLHTKDYVGPSYFNMFAEYNRAGATVGTASDGRLLGISNKFTNLVSRFAPITLNPGEAIGIVSAAETAVTTAAIGCAGWCLIDLGFTITTAPIVDPSLTLTNMVSGSDIVILEAGTETELLNVDSNASTSYEWDYDSDLVTAIDICIYKAGYVPYIIRNYSPGSTGGSIPVSQTLDRNYRNP